MSKSRDAFRTISEVSSTLDTPAHVLRFWESKFSQVKPVKRAGGRRYYRPNDVNLLAGIKRLLHEDGMTIKGAQKLLREHGVKHVVKVGEDYLLPSTTSDLEITADTPAMDTVVTSDPPQTEVSETAPEQQTPAPSAHDVEQTETTDIETSADVAESTSSKEPDDTSTIVNLEAKTGNGPSLTLNQSPSVGRLAAHARTPNVDNVTVITMPDVPADPADSDSKATARLFHMLQSVPPTKLAARREEIAPLLDRMQLLRDRIAIR